MNKRKLLLPLLALLPLTGCGQVDHVDPVSMEFGTLIGMEEKMEGYSHLTRIDISDLESKVSSKENFILLAHASVQLTCTCFSEWHDTVFAPYVKKHNLLVYLIELTELTAEGASNYGLKLNSQAATLGIFENGVLKYQHGTSDEKDAWVTSSSEFAAWMNYRVNLPTAMYINKDILDEKYKGTSSFTILYSRATCGDCSYLERNYLREYLSSNKTDSFYLINCDSVGIRYVVGEDGKTYGPNNKEGANEYELEAYGMWNDFKVDYGLAYGEDNPAGWSTGYVPTIYHINPDASGSGRKIGDVIDGAAVLYNDTIDAETLTINSTYFTSERLEIEALSYLKNNKEIDDANKVLTNKKVKEKGDRGNSVWRREETSIYHNPICKAFLDAFAKA
ncbi:MAG: hypothetical protein K6B65_01345 [Bacilli bacterium]|nr:hypothetical protein [Bacilli bacterium]